MPCRASTVARRCVGVLGSVICALIPSAGAFAQTAPTDSDPTRPIFVSLRPEFYRVADDVWRTQVIVRYDTAALRNRRWLGGQRGILVRLELPAVAAAAPSVGTEGGIGDAYGQLLVVPRLGRRFTYVVGTGLFVPTATDTLIGGGKWTLAPAAAPVWFLPGGGLFYVKFQNFSSFAGDSDRADVNFFLITPTLIRGIGRRSWVLVDSETMSDWRQDGRTSIKSGVQLGHIVARGFGLWLKPEVYWGPHHGGRWNFKTGVVWYR